MRRTTIRGALVAVGAVMLTSGCAFQGLNSLPLPGAVGRGPGANIYHVEVDNVGTLESNSPVLMNDVVVGSVGKMSLRGWHADVEISVKPDIDIPANAVASVGQTSLLGSMHVALSAPLGEKPSGRLVPGATIPLSQTSKYPSTEQTLSAVAAVVNGGGLGQISEIIHNFSAALSGREGDVRDLLTRLDNFVGVLDEQRDSIVASIKSLNRLSGTFAGQSDAIDRVLTELPPALDVLIKERPALTTALSKLGTFSDTASGVVNDVQADLVQNLKNLEPALKGLADIGPDIGKALAYATTFPYSQGLIDRAVRGDYMNLYAVLDFTVPRLKRGLFLGTRWGEEHAKLVPAPGDPWYLNYTYEPLSTGVSAPPQGEDGAPLSAASAPMPPVDGPVLPVVPPAFGGLFAVPSQEAVDQIFAGPYSGGH
ncbi:MCE family protein [Mycobacterium sp. DL592]|uniref:MCE family protein n=1 Tax=Mycobacterium sp. DL592 TaxID=2675524 RepID=UPI00141EC7E8|nr:MCE family protein [Mycobacterium sp. DL592]